MPSIRHPRPPLRLWLPPLLCAAALAACASDPSPAPALAVGTASLESARSAGAPEFAAVELGQARDKLDSARAQAQAGHNREAIRLAEEADADAQVARATAGAERSRRAVAEVDASLRTLREETQRAPGTGPAGVMPPPASMPAPTPVLPGNPVP